MFDKDSVFTGRFSLVPKSDLSPNGRLLSIWNNAQGGTFYMDICDLTHFAESHRKKGNEEQTAFFSDIIQKLQAEKKRLDGPRFPFN
ncbi:MAG: hypothetical protein R3D88_01250 [Alphaproteobacteria bacterium]|nr:hypothetical protein [Alphaproteobacteria bacterium]